MAKLYTAHKLGGQEKLSFQSESAEQAMQSLLYFLNLSHKDESAKIIRTNSGLFLYTIHNGNTWTIKND